MGNKMKKLICSLLAAAMLVTSVGVVSLAAPEDTAATEETTTVTETVAEDASTADQTDEEKEAADTETTETAADSTAAPEATEAPAATTSGSNGSYENDDYYKKALTLDSALGIISGYEDGSVRPESKVTRAEMASIVLRMLNLSGDTTYKNIFTDVDASHWAAGQIQAAYEAGIVSGMGDGTFAPDSEVTYAQVIVMLVNAMNYTNDAEYYGGWQQGYIKTAGDIGLLKSAPGSADVASDRGVVIKMVYNALLNDYNNPTSYDAYGNPKYENDKTLAEVKFDVIEKKGILQGTAKTTILANTDVQDGQIIIKPDGNDNATAYDTELTGLEDYLAQKVTYYYKEFGGRTTVVYAVIPDNAKSETYVIDDVDTIESLTGFENGNGKIKIEKVSKEKDCTDALIIYNGKALTAPQYTAAKDAATGAAKLRFGDDFNSFLTPENGSIKLVKTDSSSNVYDVVFVDSYDTVVVQSTTATRLTGNAAYPDANATTTAAISAKTTYSMNLDDTVDRTVTVTKAGSEARLRNLKKNDVANIKRSLDDTVVDVIVSGESITGAASGVTIKRGDSHATINGDKYEVANIAVGDLQAGVQSTFYLDSFGKVGYIEKSTAGKLEAGEKYGLMMSAYDSENKQDFIVQMYTTDGKAEELKFADSVEYWAPTAAAATTIKDDAIKTTVTALLGNTTTLVKMGDTPIRLVKYKTNSSGKITRLYCAVNKATADEDSGALRVDPTDLNKRESIGGAVAGYTIADGITEFSAPKDIEDMKDAANYAVGEVKASNYVVKENGSSRNFIVGEFESSSPQILINFTASSKAAAQFSDMDSAGSGPSILMAESFDTGVDDDDNDIYTINGYNSTADASVTTNKNTVFGTFKSPIYGGTGNRYYQATVAWDGTGTTYANVDLTTLVSEGDILIYSGDGKIIGKFSDAKALGAKVFNNAAYTLPIGNQKFPSSSRVGYYFGELQDSDLSDTAWVNVDGVADNIIFDPSKVMDLCVISKDNDGNIKAKIDKDGVTVGELQSAKDVADGLADYADYVFVSVVNKGDIGTIMVYRFEK